MKRFTNKSGFTLVELLVVIGIMLIASSILFVGIGGGGDGTKLSSAQRVLSSVAQGARGQAILKGAPTRLIIYSDQQADGADDEKKLRYVGIVYWGDDTDNDGNVTATGWKAGTQGTYLPEGIYFNPDLSKDKDGGAIPTMSLNYPRITVGSNISRTDGGGDEEYYYYEFNSNGTMATRSADNPSADFTNSWLALQAGTLKPNQDGDLAVDFTDEEKELLRAALIFRRVGSTTLVDDPEDIN